MSGEKIVNLRPDSDGAQYHCLVRVKDTSVRLNADGWHALPTDERDDDGYEIWQVVTDR